MTGAAYKDEIRTADPSLSEAAVQAAAFSIEQGRKGTDQSTRALTHSHLCACVRARVCLFACVYMCVCVVRRVLCSVWCVDRSLRACVCVCV